MRPQQRQGLIDDVLLVALHRVHAPHLEQLDDPARIQIHHEADPTAMLRQVLHGSSTPSGYCLETEFVRGIRLLGELGLSFDLCMRREDLGDATTPRSVSISSTASTAGSTGRPVPGASGRSSSTLV